MCMFNPNFTFMFYYDGNHACQNEDGTLMCYLYIHLFITRTTFFSSLSTLLINTYPYMIQVTSISVLGSYVCNTISCRLLLIWLHATNIFQSTIAYASHNTTSACRMMFSSSTSYNLFFTCFFHFLKQDPFFFRLGLLCLQVVVIEGTTWGN